MLPTDPPTQPDSAERGQVLVTGSGAHLLAAIGLRPIDPATTIEDGPHDPGPVPARPEPDMLATLPVDPDRELARLRQAMTDLATGEREIRAAAGDEDRAGPWRTHTRIAAALVASAAARLDEHLVGGGALPTAWAKAHPS